MDQQIKISNRAFPGGGAGVGKPRVGLIFLSSEVLWSGTWWRSYFIFSREGGIRQGASLRSSLNSKSRNPLGLVHLFRSKTSRAEERLTLPVTSFPVGNTFSPLSFFFFFLFSYSHYDFSVFCKELILQIEVGEDTSEGGSEMGWSGRNITCILGLE